MASQQRVRCRRRPAVICRTVGFLLLLGALYIIYGPPDAEVERRQSRHLLSKDENETEGQISENENLPETSAVTNQVHPPTSTQTGTKKTVQKQEPTKATTTTASRNSTEVPPTEEYCTPPAYHEFPRDLFGQRARARGAVIVHVLVVVYMFYAVAVVCDDYFISSLEECCGRMNLSEDVAGATFMAAGSSAPELFTAILGVLIAKGDVGTGTIVGSAVFNVLFVIGICGIFAGRVVTLNWWPLFRDSIYYAFTVIVLIIIIYDSEVTWYESVTMLVFYVVYIIIMKFNSELHRSVVRLLGFQEEERPSALGILSQNSDKKCYSSYVPFNNEIDNQAAQTPVTGRVLLPADEVIKNSKRRITFSEACFVIMMSRHFRPIVRFQAAARFVISEHQRQRRRPSTLTTQTSLDPTEVLRYNRARSFSVAMSEATWKRIPTRADGILAMIKWVLQVPVLAVLHYTIPDCKKEQFRKFFLLTFFTSITWTAIFSYVMVWMVTLIGFTMGIPDTIMGITFLAAGTSVPDAFSSLVVARQGQGDMAVSNSLGSNVFDILVGLALPWFIQTSMVEPGSVSYINSRGMIYAVVLLFLTIIITIAGVHFSGWQLTKRLGYALLIIYGIFLVISTLLEYNVLGYVNPPMCEE